MDPVDQESTKEYLPGSKNSPYTNTTNDSGAKAQKAETAHWVLESELNKLHESLDALENRLASVRNALPMPELDPTEAHGGSAVVNKVDQFVRTVTTARSRISQILSELEV